MRGTVVLQGNEDGMAGVATSVQRDGLDFWTSYQNTFIGTKTCHLPETIGCGPGAHSEMTGRADEHLRGC